MEIAPIVIVLAGAAALLHGGSLPGLLATDVRAFGLVVASFVVQLAFVIWPPEWMTRASAAVILVLTQGAVVAFLLINRHLPGTMLMLAGVALNLVVIVANGAMPVSESASRAAGTEFLTDQRHVEHGMHLRNEVLDEGTVFPWLADVVPLPIVRQVASVGDLILGAGIARLVYKRMKADASPAPAVGVDTGN